MTIRKHLYSQAILLAFSAGTSLTGCSSKVVDLGNDPNGNQPTWSDAGMPDYQVLQREFFVGGLAHEGSMLYWHSPAYNPPPEYSAASTTFTLRSLDLAQPGASVSSYPLVTVAGGQDYYTNPSGLQIEGDSVYWPSHDYAANGDGMSRCSKANCSTPEFLGDVGTMNDWVVQNDQIFWITWAKDRLSSQVYSCEASNCVATKAQIPMNAASGVVAYTRSMYLAADDSYLYTNEIGTTGTTSRIVRVRKDGTGVFQEIGTGYGPFVLSDSSIIFTAKSATASYFAVVSCPKSGCVGQPKPLLDGVNFGIDSLVVDSRSIYFGASVGRDSSNQMISELGRCDIAGCTSPTFLAMANRPFAHILSDEQFLYFTATTLPTGIDDCSSHKTVDIGIPCNQPQGFVGEMAITW